MSEDELSALQEQLAEARAENERLQATAADREARALHLDELNGQLREQLAAAQADLSAGQGELSSVQAGLSAAQAEKDDLHARLQAAVGKYREVLLAAAPEVVQEMVGGESIEQVDAAMERARQTVLQVRERLESQAQAGRVPMGSPPRTAPDLSALSPIEKIRLGLGQK
jgi:multidrug efflux pump subunit AcrA (membrane-fusion protein)